MLIFSSSCNLMVVTLIFSLNPQESAPFLCLSNDMRRKYDQLKDDKVSYLTLVMWRIIYMYTSHTTSIVSHHLACMCRVLVILGSTSDFQMCRTTPFYMLCSHCTLPIFKIAIYIAILCQKGLYTSCSSLQVLVLN